MAIDNTDLKIKKESLVQKYIGVYDKPLEYYKELARINTIIMKKPKCYNCKHKSEYFKIEKLTHTHCVNPKLYKEEDFISGKCGGWDTLRVFSDTCDEHEFKV